MNMELDNIIFGLQAHGGISVYWAELLTRAARCGMSWSDPFSGSGNRIRENLKAVPFHPTAGSWPMRIERYRGVRSSSAAVHSSYYRIPESQKTALITSVYDFTYEKYRGGPALWTHHFQKMRAIRRATKILCISESTARDVVKIGGKDLASRVIVTHLAASEIFKPISDASDELQKKYPWLSQIVQTKRLLLFVGARTNYKRFDLAVQATEGYPDGHLIVVGGGEASKSDAILIQDLVRQNRISFLPSVPASELPLWYNTAHALFYLSDYEGFGLPVLEAAQCQCPVLAQNTSSIPEVYGEHSFLLPQGAMLGAAIDALKQLEDSHTRKKLAKACSDHAGKFSWDRCWDETHAAYRLL